MSRKLATNEHIQHRSACSWLSWTPVLVDVEVLNVMKAKH